MSQLIASSLQAQCLQVDWLLSSYGPVLSELSGGFGGYGALVEPDRTAVADAYYTWARSRLQHHHNRADSDLAPRP